MRVSVRIKMRVRVSVSWVDYEGGYKDEYKNEDEAEGEAKCQGENECESASMSCVDDESKHSTQHAFKIQIQPKIQARSTV